HLPDVGDVDMLGSIGSPPDKCQAGAVEHHHAGAGSIWKLVVRGHSECRYSSRRFLRLAKRYDDFALIATIVIGTRKRPRDSAFLAQSEMRAMVAGCAVAKPTAVPLSRAFISSRASA